MLLAMFKIFSYIEASRGAVARGVTVNSATQHAMPPEFGRKWGTECLNTRFPLPTLLYGRQREADFSFIINILCTRLKFS